MSEQLWKGPIKMVHIPSELKLTGFEMQAIWLLLKSGDKFMEEELAGIGRTVFKLASSDDVHKLLELAELIGFVERQQLKGESAWTSTEEGHAFRSLPHWRFWQVGLSTKFNNLFLSIDDLPENRPPIIDLFCGAGGLTLGFESAGFSTCLAVDNDELACKSFKTNFPRCQAVQDDILKVASTLDKGSLPEFGITPGKLWGIIGGPPCQSFSNIGERNPNDSRSSLVHIFMDMVAKLEPSFFVMENVPGLAKIGLHSNTLDLLKMKAKSVGPLATFIVASLPDLTANGSTKAVDDERKRKRAVAESIRSFRKELEQSSPGVGMCNAVVENAYEGLRCELKEHISTLYGINSAKALAALNSCLVEIAEIAISECLVQFELRFDEDAEIKSVLSSISNPNVPHEIVDAAKRIIRDEEIALKMNTSGDVEIGPFLSASLEVISDKYDVCEPLILNAAEFGDPQNRKRVFVIGINRNMGISPKSKDVAAKFVSPITAGEALDDLPNVDDCKFLQDDEIPSCLLGTPANDFARVVRLESIMPGDKAIPRVDWNPFVVNGCKRTIHTVEVKKRYADLPKEHTTTLVAELDWHEANPLRQSGLELKLIKALIRRLDQYTMHIAV